MTTSAHATGPALPARGRRNNRKAPALPQPAARGEQAALPIEQRAISFGPNYEGIRVLQLADLRIDRAYQTSVSAPALKRLRDAFVPEFCPPLSVNIRDDEASYIIDGQHRREVLLDRGVTEFPCYVWRGLHLQEEAQRFEATRARTKRADERMKIAWRAGDPLAIELVAAIWAEGYFLDRGSLPEGVPETRVLTCPETLKKLATAHTVAVLRSALRAYAVAWPIQRVNIYVLNGIAQFIYLATHHNPSGYPFDFDRLVKRLRIAKHHKLTQEIKGADNTKNVDRRARNAIAEEYNRQARNRLDIDELVHQMKVDQRNARRAANA